MKRFFTSESVTEGHPDKICDQISDAILDAILEKDKDARVACETVATTGTVIVFGEISTNCYVDIPTIVKNTIKDIGYTREAHCGFDGDAISVFTLIDEQSPDIAQGVDRTEAVDKAESIGAGDQGMMFGFACDETEELMPLPIMLSHKLAKKLSEVRKSGELDYLRPDGKTQVTVEYEDDIPVRVDTVVVSSQHTESVSQDKLKEDIIEKVIKQVIPSKLLDEKTRYLVNPTGKFVIGGPAGDSGLTGRKIIVDTYGGYAPHGGGAFSGKDATKVDRSAAYMARYVAKNLVAAGVAKRCELQVAYSIGVAAPVSIYVTTNTKGTGIVSDEEITKGILKLFDLRPYSIIKKFDLFRPIYKQTAAYGHFGNPSYPWEQLDMVDKIKEYFKVK